MPILFLVVPISSDNIYLPYHHPLYVQYPGWKLGQPLGGSYEYPA
jgi:hypothetical protein